MFYRRKGWLRKEYDEKLLAEMAELKQTWLNQKALLEKCVEPTDELVLETKMAEAKYFYLFKEAKYRQVKIKR
ncbi:YaaL family protein [Bacillus testis]|uniref:YaaL family protein n=1 Tax=Bacillus testis TaxID=1622072 RepID=UPI00067F131C|nr:YaaL family protein [Bacillus testis]